jgi:hypothetical protein
MGRSDADTIYIARACVTRIPDPDHHEDQSRLAVLRAVYVRRHPTACPADKQMSTARGRDGGQTQSGGVKGLAAPDPGSAESDD